MTVSTTDEPTQLRLGTCSWSTKDWVGKFYTTTNASEFITEYARVYDTVEIDSTFYSTPRKEVVLAWRKRTPEGFLFAAKIPKTITHEKFLTDCDKDLEEFLATVSLLGSRLGPLLFQFPYYAKDKGITLKDFLAHLEPFLAKLPKDGFRFALEVRNKTWLKPPLMDLLQAHGVTLALIDHPWMPRADELMKDERLVTGPFAYIRWLGDRYAIEKITTTWNQCVIDRSQDLEGWVPLIKRLLDKRIPVFGFVNNHYAGYAPDNVEHLKRVLNEA
ncbi:MAG: DUF72 domain-containing protein [Candidatus Hydrogenedentes bacterium]|nr:DUF72 domain-containing protein [Candidatus Hydrogenedentota bacterium]